LHQGKSKRLFLIADIILNNKDKISIRTRGLEKIFQVGPKRVQAFNDLDLAVRQGEFFAIVGPSGCGKTTLLRCFAGIDKPTSGYLEIETELPSHGGNLAMVFQEHGLYPWMSVKENLNFVLKASNIEKEKHEEIIRDLLAQVGLSRFSDFYPYQLSGGMNQRVALLRAFCVHPQILLMDEPFVFLDYQNRISLQSILLKLWSRQKQTIVFVTHNINEAVALADRVVVMSKGPGRIKREIICDFERPRNIVALRQNPVYQKIVVEITEELKVEIDRETNETIL